MSYRAKTLAFVYKRVRYSERRFRKRKSSCKGNGLCAYSEHDSECYESREVHVHRKTAGHISHRGKLTLVVWRCNHSVYNNRSFSFPSGT